MTLRNAASGPTGERLNLQRTTAGGIGMAANPSPIRSAASPL
jgi:hypothetical protein